jgi:peptide/nickel transport system substrate-binding protein
VIAVRVEADSLSTRPLVTIGTALHVPQRLFNAKFALRNNEGEAQPELGERFPVLNSESWRVFPDGRMESTYRLKPNLIWHDGTPLTAEDWVFGWRVYTQPGLGQSSAPPFDAIESAVAVDPQTMVVHWNRPFPGAEHLSDRGRELLPLPRHLLREGFERGDMEAFASHPYWSRDYVGLGPYRLEHWEPGAYLDTVAFDQYVLGRPKIDRIRILPVGDPNTVLARMLAGELHVATDGSIGQHADLIRREWEPRQAGRVLHWPNAWRYTAFQLRPDLASPRAIQDLRVRKAIAHAIDRDAINEAVYGGQIILSNSPVWERSEYGRALEQATGLVRYAFDLRRSELLMAEAGFTRGGEGIYVGPGGRFSGEIQTTSGADNEPEAAIMADGFRRNGFDVRENVLSNVLAQDNQLRASFPTMSTANTNMGIRGMLYLVSDDIPSPANRWRGGNRGGWSNPEYDHIMDAFATTLDRGQQIGQVARAATIVSEDLPAVPLFFRSQPFVHVSELVGPETSAPEASIPWNVHTWELR